MNIRELVDVKAGTQSRKIFWDRDIYELELERVFGRCWLFLAHESQIPNAGDYVVSKMGEDEVIVWRQADGGIKAFLNQCRHRGTKLCMAEAGSASGLACIFHGWSYNSDGSLRNVPLEKNIYGPRFDRTQWGLRSVPKVESYRGFVFGCMDPQAPGLPDYLGDKKYYIDVWTDVPGGIELLGPPGRSILRTNWKLPTEGFVGDTYHVAWTHASLMKALSDGTVRPLQDYVRPDVGIQFTTRYGHGAAIQFSRQSAILHQISPDLVELFPERQREEVAREKGDTYARLYTGLWDASIFPNCSYLIGLNMFKCWHPIGPDKIEVTSWVIAEKRMSDEAKRKLKIAAHRAFGTAGLLESDDSDNFEYCVAPNRGYFTRQGIVNAQMGLGATREDPEYPGIVGEMVSECAVRGYYRFYADCLESQNWDELNRKSELWKEQMLG